MAPTYTVLFTVLPRGLSINTPTLPVSVLVSPRLVGPDRLNGYPDWVDWTQKLKRDGARLTFQCGARTLTLPIDTAPLRPDLWRALFGPDTFVRSRIVDDYSKHRVVSFSVRESLSALKAVYQEAGVVLALPDPPGVLDPNDPAAGESGAGTTRSSQPTNRARLKAILEGLDVHWGPEKARRWREVARERSAAGVNARTITGALDREGLITAARNPAAFQGIAGPFAAYHRMPTPTAAEAGPVTIDPDSYDFHQALSALDVHPALQRALGLVFDFDLPADFVPTTTTGTTITLSVRSAAIAWQLAPQSPPLETACVHLAAANTRLFGAASRTQTKEGGPFQVVGLLNLDPARFGLAQVDVDGGMHKAIATAEIYNNPDPARSELPADPLPAPNPEVHDPDATLPSLRSGGLQLYVDSRGATVLDAIARSTAFNTALEQGGAARPPFYAEDLIRGYRIDIWESRTNRWHSLHRRSGAYRIGEREVRFDTKDEEGFIQLAATQPAPGAGPADKDLYVHEVIARWGGWSLSAPFPGRALSRYGEPERALPDDPDDPDFRTDEALTAFKVRAKFKVVPGSLPRLRFGSRYRVRVRPVDLAGNSLALGDATADALSTLMALPQDPEGQPYLRYDPVAAPLVVIRDPAALTGAGSGVHRLVIRSYNAGRENDGIAADLTASDRHIVPPRTSVEMAERMGMLDGADGKLKTDAATWELAAARDEGKLATTTIDIAGKTTDDVPLESAESLDALPYLPDLLSRGAAMRDLPGGDPLSVGRVTPGDADEGAVPYAALTDVNPRSGSATIVSFNHQWPGAAGVATEWEKTVGFRLALADAPLVSADGGAPDAAALRPRWDPAARLLTVFLPKGQTAVVPLSSYLTPRDLTLMGQWQWLREFVDLATIFGAQPAHLRPELPVDLLAQVLQRAVEGGHWLITPPTLLTLVHAVQQPLGQPAFAALNVGHTDTTSAFALQSDRIRNRADAQELAPVTAWRRLHETSAYLMGALRIHGASTAKVNLFAAWTDPVDMPSEPQPRESLITAPVDELPLPKPREGYLVAPGAARRRVGYYDPENDQVAMVRSGDHAGPAATSEQYFGDAAPKHELGDTKRHLVRYTAVATSRYREYFPPDAGLDFTRSSEEVVVDVPASERPLAPGVVYVIPTFGWQRQTDTNMKRSVRYGGGLRVYLERGWFSSGVGELLGVALWNPANGPLDDAHRDKYRPFFTQWGMDPIWKTAGLTYAPQVRHFPDAVASDIGVSLAEVSARVSDTQPGRVDVVGFAPQFDATRNLWFADFTIDLSDGPTYSPFVHLALVRYQPHALDDARISTVVQAGFVQLTPDRTALVTADPYHPRTLRLVVSGVAPQPSSPLAGPAEEKPARPTHVQVRVQKRTPLGGELGWEDAPAADATVAQFYEGHGLNQPDLGLWIGAVTFTAAPAAGVYRLLIEEFEYISANYADGRRAPGRLIYAETVNVDAAIAGS